MSVSSQCGDERLEIFGLLIPMNLCAKSHWTKGDVDALIEQPNWSQRMQLASMNATTASIASLGSAALRTNSGDARAGFHSA
jgi:hypothetical protein